MVTVVRVASGVDRSLWSVFPIRVRQFAGWFALGLVAFGAEVVVLGVVHQWLGCPLWLAAAVAARGVLLGRVVSTHPLVFGHPLPPIGPCCGFHFAAMGYVALTRWLVEC